MDQMTALKSFQAALEAQDSPLAAPFEAVAALAATQKLWHFEAAPPLAPAERERLLAAAEAQHGGRLLLELRESLLGMYAICNGFTFVVAPASLPEPAAGEAALEAWRALGRPVGYMFFPLAMLAECATPLRVVDDSEPSYEDGGLQELYDSDLEEGAVPDTAGFRYASFVGLGREGRFSHGAFYNETPTRSLALTSDKFPGGWLGQDGDGQPILYLDDEEAPDRTPFDAVLAQELEEALGALG